MIARPPAPGDLEVVLALLRAADASVAGDSDWTASMRPPFASKLA